LQGGLFLPPAPEPEKLQITLARISAMAGEGNAGSPELLNTHRPDAFVMKAFSRSMAPHEDKPKHVPQLVLRIFRPALRARVRLRSQEPRYVTAPGVQGEVIEAAGPWRSSGDWWTQTRWARDEWDVAVDRNGLYRIYCDLDAHEWFVEGVFD
jgi:protein ImuB